MCGDFGHNLRGYALARILTYSLPGSFGDNQRLDRVCGTPQALRIGMLDADSGAAETIACGNHNVKLAPTISESA